MRTLDGALGGDWWRHAFRDGLPDPATRVVEEYKARLRRESGLRVNAVPVRRNPRHLPLYYLLNVTAHPSGTWAFAQSAAQAQARWRLEFGEREANGQGSLFEYEERGDVVVLESEARMAYDIEANMHGLVDSLGGFQLQEQAESLFGAHFGYADESIVRRAVRNLENRGAIEVKSKAKGVGTWLVRRIDAEASVPTTLRQEGDRPPSASYRPTA